MDALGEDVGLAEHTPDRFRKVIEQLTAYFNGDQPDFTFSFDYGAATPFQKAVWEATRSIPYGETRSYAWVAQKIGKKAAVRAVGQALGKNPFPIIVPCHRVLASDGSLCGFGGGIEMKKRLLELEGHPT
jgi:O-6-methylguanine DNA methyltransferase